ncbi:hypothetical protein [Paracoccus sp. MC1862]|uniref:hypothetical protein n=1 Tax=Paracoccus sp. MC1862 TaxID=2760307 RepID=UPI001601349B|nr:hypothetical protein [Paracoccus sp. MC1862]MBB1498497.1 hypothetical protein [Paracoccus sp. MC1862]QQO43845.1 hypothetical protein JGR78_10445 [Paracoccus sp. MC1862]
MDKLAKLNRPPAAENWARLQHPSVGETTKKLYCFMKGSPTWNYLPARNASLYHIEDRISRATALEVVERSGSRLGRPYNIELINAFFDHAEKSPFDGVPAFKGFSQFFPLGRNVGIPVRPLAVVRRNGRFSPIFLCPWSSEGLSQYQKSLYMTILEKAIFTLTDFDDAEGQVLLFPKCSVQGGVKKRTPVVWRRGEVPLLSDKDFLDQIKIFFEGQKMAAKLLSSQ